MHNESFIKQGFMKEPVMRSTRPRRALPGSIAAGADDLSVHFEGLANPTRLAVVELLAQTNEIRVSELAELCQVSQPRMSWHLRILRKAQVVQTRRDGREVLCSLDRTGIAHSQKRFNDLLSGRRHTGAVTTSTSTQPITEGQL